jgi:hypothetical protein
LVQIATAPRPACRCRPPRRTQPESLVDTEGGRSSIALASHSAPERVGILDCAIRRMLRLTSLDIEAGGTLELPLAR